MKNILAFIFILSWAPLWSQEISFDDLKKAQHSITSLNSQPAFIDKKIVILGYPQKDSLGNWYLTEQPHVKTCCLSKNILGPNLLIDYHFTETYDGPIKIEGTLKLENVKKNLQFVLSEVTFTKNDRYSVSPHAIPWRFLTLLALLSALIFYVTKRKSVV